MRIPFLGIVSVSVLIALPAGAEKAAWITDSGVGANTVLLGLEIGCTGDPVVCSFIDGYNSARNTALDGSGVAELIAGGSFELLLDDLLSTPEITLDVWSAAADDVSYDPIPLIGTPEVTDALVFGAGGGPFAVPGLVFDAFGPVPIAELQDVGLKFDLSLGPEMFDDQVAGPGPEFVSGDFEMVDPTKFEVRNLTWSLAGSDCSADDPACDELPDPCDCTTGLVISITTTGAVTMNLSGELLFTLSVGRSELSWSSLGGATGYDIVRGDLGTLVGSGGDFTLATEACVGNDLSGDSVAYTLEPAPGAGHWFLARWIAAGPANGSYDVPFGGQLEPRDAAVDAAPASCP